jgi:hypothetical protein
MGSPLKVPPQELYGQRRPLALAHALRTRTVAVGGRSGVQCVDHMQPYPCECAHARTRTHTHAHARTRTRTHTHAHARTRTRTHTHGYNIDAQAGATALTVDRVLAILVRVGGLAVAGRGAGVSAQYVRAQLGRFVRALQPQVGGLLHFIRVIAKLSIPCCLLSYALSLSFPSLVAYFHTRYR